MYCVKLNRSLPRLINVLRRSQSQTLAEENEYTEVPEYPPIMDLSLSARKRRELDAVYEKIRNINTVEEKQIALNMPRYYGFKSVMLKEDKFPYDSMPLVKCYTRSHFVNTTELPDSYKESAEVADSIVKDVKSQIEDSIAMESESIVYNFSYSTEKPEQQQKEDAFAKSVVKQINRIISNNLSDKIPHILAAQVDYDPRHEAFWFVGGSTLHRSIVRARNKIRWMRENNMVYKPVDRPIQYLGTPILTLRSNHPLKALVPYSESENPDFKVPKLTYQPESIGFFTEHRHATNIPGFWPGDYDEFGFVSYHSCSHISTRNPSFGIEDNQDALHSQGMLTSFGWLLAQANYLGFNTYNDITYPLVTQTVLTNGQYWSLYAYQLNTITMHNEQIDENPKHNICYGTKQLKLYESIENGKVKGLNENVLKMLVQFYMNTPEKRDYELKPYLGKDEQVVADIEDDNKRVWLEKTYKHIVSNRPRHLLAPEIYQWEHIYKIRFSTRPQEARRRPFELGVNPFKRRLNEHLPPYIPKVLRPYPKSKKKFETTYYPDV